MDKQLEKQETEYILKDLLRSRNQDDIIREVCWRTGCEWIEAEYLLERTIRENKALLRQEKSPLRMGISILAAAAGLVWVMILLIGLLAPLVRYWLENSRTLTGYVWAPVTGGFLFQLVLAIALIVIGIILITQQLKMITR